MLAHGKAVVLRTNAKVTTQTTWCLPADASGWRVVMAMVMVMVMVNHYSDVIMGVMASQMTSLTIVDSTVYSGTDQRNHQRSASLAFVRGIHRSPVNSPHKWSATWKMLPFDDVIIWWRLELMATVLVMVVPKGLIHKPKTTLFQVMAWRLFSAKPLTEPILCIGTIL